MGHPRTGGSIFDAMLPAPIEQFGRAGLIVVAKSEPTPDRWSFLIGRTTLNGFGLLKKGPLLRMEDGQSYRQHTSTVELHLRMRHDG